MIYIRTEVALIFVHPKSLKNFTYFSYSNALSPKCTLDNLFEARKRILLYFCPKIPIRPEKDKEIFVEEQDVLSKCQNVPKFRRLLETEDLLTTFYAFPLVKMI